MVSRVAEHHAKSELWRQYGFVLKAYFASVAKYTGKVFCGDLDHQSATRTPFSAGLQEGIGVFCCVVLLKNSVLDAAEHGRNLLTTRFRIEEGHRR